MPVEIRISQKGTNFAALKRNADQLSKKTLAVGVLPSAGKDKDTGADLVDIATWNEYGTSRIPERPFMRIAESKNSESWLKLAEGVAEKIVEGKFSEEQGMELIGNRMVGDIQKVIGDKSQLAPNAPSTIKRKKSDAPLIDTGNLRQSISFEVR